MATRTKRRPAVAPVTPEERWRGYAPEFKAKIAALAEVAGKTVEAVAGWWLEYERACSGEGGQSTIFSEFIRWYAAKLFGEPGVEYGSWEEVNRATDAKVRDAVEKLEAKFGWI